MYGNLCIKETPSENTAGFLWRVWACSFLLNKTCLTILSGLNVFDPHTQVLQEQVESHLVQLQIWRLGQQANPHQQVANFDLGPANYHQDQRRDANSMCCPKILPSTDVNMVHIQITEAILVEGRKWAVLWRVWTIQATQPLELFHWTFAGQQCVGATCSLQSQRCWVLTVARADGLGSAKARGKVNAPRAKRRCHPKKPHAGGKGCDLQQCTGPSQTNHLRKRVG